MRGDDIPTVSENDAAVAANVAAPATPEVPAEEVALARLAATVLRKSHGDLSALAEADPGIVGDWIATFARLKAKAEADARLWSAALASLSTAASPLAAEQLSA